MTITHYDDRIATNDEQACHVRISESIYLGFMGVCDLKHQSLATIAKIVPIIHITTSNNTSNTTFLFVFLSLAQNQPSRVQHLSEPSPVR